MAAYAIIILNFTVFIFCGSAISIYAQNTNLTARSKDCPSISILGSSKTFGPEREVVLTPVDQTRAGVSKLVSRLKELEFSPLGQWDSGHGEVILVWANPQQIKKITELQRDHEIRHYKLSPFNIKKFKFKGFEGVEPDSPSVNAKIVVQNADPDLLSHYIDVMKAFGIEIQNQRVIPDSMGRQVIIEVKSPMRSLLRISSLKIVAEIRPIRSTDIPAILPAEKNLITETGQFYSNGDRHSRELYIEKTQFGFRITLRARSNEKWNTFTQSFSGSIASHIRDDSTLSLPFRNANFFMKLDPATWNLLSYRLVLDSGESFGPSTVFKHTQVSD